MARVPAYQNASIPAAVAYAAHDTLVALYPSQTASFATPSSPCPYQGIPPRPGEERPGGGPGRRREHPRRPDR